MAQSTLLINNNATSTLAGAITSTALTAQLAAGTGVLFPNPGANQYFVMTFTNATTLVSEIVHVTAISGDTITIVRAQEGTEALGWSAGDLAQNLITAGTFAAFVQQSGSLPVSYAGNPNGFVAGTQGSPGTNGIPTICFDVTNLIGYFCSTTGNAASAVWSPMSGQAVQFAGGTSTGSANAQAVTPVTPGGFALIAGYSVTFTPGYTNTGATTLNIVSTGVIACRKNSGGSLVPFSGSEFTATEPATVVYNGTYWVLQTSTLGAMAALNIGYGIDNDGSGNAEVSSYALATVASAANLIGGSAGAVKTASWTVDEIVAAVALGGKKYLGSSLTLAFNGAGTGAGGMDTGSMPSSGDLSIYAIYDPGVGWSTLGTTACNGSVYTGSNMPAGYTASALLSVVVTTNVSQFTDFYQIGRTVYITDVQVLSSGSSTTPASVSLSGVAPAKARSWGGWAIPTVGVSVAIQADASDLGRVIVGSEGVGSFQVHGAVPPVVIKTSQTFYYQMVDSSGSASVYLSSYSF